MSVFGLLVEQNPNTADGARSPHSAPNVFLIDEEFYMYEGTTRITTGRAYTARKGGCIGIGMASVRSSGKWDVPFV